MLSNGVASVRTVLYPEPSVNGLHNIEFQQDFIDKDIFH